MEVNLQKVYQPSTVMEFLGIVIDSDRMELRMSQERLDDVTLELESWNQRGAGVKRELLSLLGKLVFMCRIIRPGRIFLRCLFNSVSKLKYLHHRVKLPLQALKDIRWWLNFARSWNKKCMFYEDDWTSSTDLHLATDASDLGMGGVLGTSWFMQPFTKEQSDMSIAWRELYAILIACTIWGKRFAKQRLRIQCDNMAIVYCVNTGTSKCPKLMVLIRSLFLIACNHNFELRLEHVPGVDNIGPDRLSRLDMSAFRKHAPEADARGELVPVIELRDDF
jgi:hypothetical protein